MMSLFVGILIGFSIGLNSRKDTIINGDTYEYYQNEQFYEEYELQPFEIRLKLLVKARNNFINKWTLWGKRRYGNKWAKCKIFI